MLASIVSHHISTPILPLERKKREMSRKERTIPARRPFPKLQSKNCGCCHPKADHQSANRPWSDVICLFHNAIESKQSCARYKQTHPVVMNRASLKQSETRASLRMYVAEIAPKYAEIGNT